MCTCMHEDCSTMYLIALLNFQGEGEGEGKEGPVTLSELHIHLLLRSCTNQNMVWCSKLHALLATWGEVYYWFSIWKVKKDAKSLGIVPVRLYLQFFPVHCLWNTNKALKSKSHPVPCAREVGGREAQKNSRKDLSTSLWVHTIALDYLKSWWEFRCILYNQIFISDI